MADLGCGEHDPVAAAKTGPPYTIVRRDPSEPTSLGCFYLEREGDAPTVCSRCKGRIPAGEVRLEVYSDEKKLLGHRCMECGDGDTVYSLPGDLIAEAPESIRHLLK